MSDVNLSVGASASRLDLIDSTLHEAETSCISFGMNFLDAALIGILPTDLIVIGAATGVGKTSMAIEMAKNAGLAGHKVLFIALEAEENEIEMRIRYQHLADIYFNSSGPKNLRFDYRSFRFNRLRQFEAEHRTALDERVAAQTKNLFTYYKKEKYTPAMLKKHLEWAKGNVDLVVIDHLHYFSFESKDSENAQISGLMEELRTMNLALKVPIILVAHLRKDLQRLVPDEKDFMGTSNISKQATICITISKDPEGFGYDSNGAGYSTTLISVPKARTGSLGVVGVVQYSIERAAYSFVYSLGREDRGGQSYSILGRDQCPFWAKHDPLCKNK